MAILLPYSIIWVWIVGLYFTIISPLVKENRRLRRENYILKKENNFLRQENLFLAETLTEVERELGVISSHQQEDRSVETTINRSRRSLGNKSNGLLAKGVSIRGLSR